MKIILADRNEPIIQAWNKYFGDCENITTHHGSIFDHPCDAIVSPANSFGFMDGGIDLALSEYLGWHVQDRLQAIIKEKHHGELLIGQAELVETDHQEFPYLISAPTMRVPMNIKGTVNVYLAARAIFLLIKHGEHPEKGRISSFIHAVAISGLGTGAGKVSPNICARQMRAAYDEVILGKGHFPQTWGQAHSRHGLLYHGN